MNTAECLLHELLITELSDDELLNKPEGDYTIDDVCTEVDCCPATAWNLIKRGELDSYSVGRSRRIFRKSMADLKRRNMR